MRCLQEGQRMMTSEETAHMFSAAEAFMALGTFSTLSERRRVTLFDVPMG